eukprot:PLAT161.2.p1 GENE.PLAT161.2~~PLAT161.2.p1  ORF type:complete len:583 (+),score=252.49 PLAT161.2:131-1750(+)
MDAKNYVSTLLHALMDVSPPLVTIFQQFFQELLEGDPTSPVVHALCKDFVSILHQQRGPASVAGSKTPSEASVVSAAGETYFVRHLEAAPLASPNVWAARRFAAMHDSASEDGGAGAGSAAGSLVGSVSDEPFDYAERAEGASMATSVPTEYSAPAVMVGAPFDYAEAVSMATSHATDELMGAGGDGGDDGDYTDTLPDGPYDYAESVIGSEVTVPTDDDRAPRRGDRAALYAAAVDEDEEDDLAAAGMSSSAGDPGEEEDGEEGNGGGDAGDEFGDTDGGMERGYPVRAVSDASWTFSDDDDGYSEPSSEPWASRVRDESWDGSEQPEEIMGAPVAPEPEEMDAGSAGDAADVTLAREEAWREQVATVMTQLQQELDEASKADRYFTASNTGQLCASLLGKLDRLATSEERALLTVDSALRNRTRSIFRKYLGLGLRGYTSDLLHDVFDLLHAELSYASVVRSLRRAYDSDLSFLSASKGELDERRRELLLSQEADIATLREERSRRLAWDGDGLTGAAAHATAHEPDVRPPTAAGWA